MTTVLVADDEAGLRRLIRVTAEGEGHKVIEADDGDAAWMMIHLLRPDTVVLDVCMPGRSGFELTRSIRADPGLVGTRVVLVSGQTLVQCFRRELRRAATPTRSDKQGGCAEHSDCLSE